MTTIRKQETNFVKSVRLPTDVLYYPSKHGTLQTAPQNESLYGLNK